MILALRFLTFYVVGWGPHAYFQMLAESRNGAQQTSSNANCLSLCPVSTAEGSARGTSPILDDVESGEYERYGHYPR